MRLLRCSVLALAVSLAPCALVAQEARAKTTVVEILGLRDWTRKMVEDSVAKYQPGISLADHACAVILRDSVGFADAAAISMSWRGDTTWAVLPVVEPSLRDRVRFRTFGVERPKNPEWADLFAILERDRAAIHALQNEKVLIGGQDTAWGAPFRPPPSSCAAPSARTARRATGSSPATRSSRIPATPTAPSRRSC